MDGESVAILDAIDAIDAIRETGLPSLKIPQRRSPIEIAETLAVEIQNRDWYQTPDYPFLIADGGRGISRIAKPKRSGSYTIAVHRQMSQTPSNDDKDRFPFLILAR